jgi:serine/threonine protein phosphatase PrpC
VIPVRSLRSVAGTLGGIDVAGVSDRGPVRAENQDVWEAFELRGGGSYALLLADGMGGHTGGREAADAAVAAAARVLGEPGPAQDRLDAAVAGANAAVAEVRSRLGGYPGTTLVLALIDGPNAVVANVGDSRAYRIRGSEARALTEDHSWVAEQVRAGLLEPDELRHHLRRNVITRAVMGDPIAGDQFPVQLQPNDVLMLCSDGLWEPIDDTAIGEFFAADAPLERILDWVCDAALAAGGTDNVTAVAARWLGHQPAPEPES